MKRLIPLSILALTASAAPLSATDDVTIGGLLRADSAFSLPTNLNPAWSQSEETRVQFQPAGQNWKALIDLRFSYLGPLAAAALPSTAGLLPASVAAKLADALPLLGDAAFMRLPRAWLQFEHPFGRLTAGRFWPKTGIFGVFNPFEWSKSVGFTDTGFDRAGVDGLSWNFGLGDTGEGQLFAAPAGSITNLAGGASASWNAFGFDIGAAALRKGLSTNLAGFYLKGDLFIGVNGSWALHFDDAFSNLWQEAYAGADYSFDLGGPLLVISGGAYYAERGADATNRYNKTLSEDRYLLARLYALCDLSLAWDEGLSFGVSGFVNCVDASALIVPQVKIVPWSGVTLTLLAAIATGEGSAEFAQGLYGYGTLLARFEAKF